MIIFYRKSKSLLEGHFCVFLLLNTHDIMDKLSRKKSYYFNKDDYLRMNFISIRQDLITTLKASLTLPDFE